jgi:hypothetical protein
MIEGHGGMLDRLDSVCFAAPIFFHVTRYFYTRAPQGTRFARPPACLSPVSTSAAA